MRTLRLARVAAEAEGLRLREQARRTATRVILTVIALAFLSAAAAFAHVAGWYWLRQTWEPQHAALAIAGADFVVAGIFALSAARSRPTTVEIEARVTRDQALESARAALGTAAIATQLLRLATSLLGRRG